MTRRRPPPPPLDGAALQRLALRYVERYATTRARLAAYLARKLRERGWAGEGAPEVAGLVERFAAQGYVDDRSFAEARARTLGARGYGRRRIGAALREAGVDEEDRPALDAEAELAAARSFARRRRFVPTRDRLARQKQIAAFARAGHDLATAQQVLGELDEAGE